MIETKESEPKVTLGDLLKRARRDAGLQQGELAEKIGRSRGLVGKWERDESQPTFGDMRNIIRETGADWLLTEPFRAMGTSRSAWFDTFPGQRADVVAA